MVSEIAEHWEQYRSPREVEHQRKGEALQREQARVATEIAAATQAGDIETLATLLPRREAIALLMQRG